jgi:signal peptidase II
LQKEIKHRWWILVIITAAGFLFDWWTKTQAVRHFTQGHPVPVAGDYLQFVLLYNKAALFGLDPRRLIPGFPVNIVFTIFAGIATVVLIVYYAYLKKTELLMHLGLALVLPGAIGNLFDRIVYPGRGVVDFIMVDLKVWPFHPWPVFNMADAYVTVGVGVLLLSMVLDERRKKKKPVAA